MSKPIVKTPRKAAVKMFEARYWHGAGELDSFFFVSDGTRKPLKKEAQDAYKKMSGDSTAKVKIEDVYQIGELCDYTTNKSYKIMLRVK